MSIDALRQTTTRIRFPRAIKEGIIQGVFMMCVRMGVATRIDYVHGDEHRCSSGELESATRESRPRQDG